MAFTTRQTPAEIAEVLAERRGLGVHGVLGGEGVADAVLGQVVARRHLAAEAVAAMLDAHPARLVGKRVNEHRHVQPGQAQGIRDSPLVAEVRQGDEDAVDLSAVGLEELGALLRVGPRLHRPVLRLLRAQGDGLDALFLQHGEDGLAALLAELGGEKAAVAHQHPECRHSDSP